jgi:predicted HTH domain antitoxin
LGRRVVKTTKIEQKNCFFFQSYQTQKRKVTKLQTMSQITIELSQEILSVRGLPPEEFVREMRLAAAIYWYQKSEISQEKAAKIAGLNRRDFLAALAREQIDVFAVDFDQLQGELDRG